MSLEPLNTVLEDEIDAFVERVRTRFTQIAKEKNLQMKAFLEEPAQQAFFKRMSRCMMEDVTERLSKFGFGSNLIEKAWLLAQGTMTRIAFNGNVSAKKFIRANAEAKLAVNNDVLLPVKIGSATLMKRPSQMSIQEINQVLPTSGQDNSIRPVDKQFGSPGYTRNPAAIPPEFRNYYQFESINRDELDRVVIKASYKGNTINIVIPEDKLDDLRDI